MSPPLIKERTLVDTVNTVLLFNIKHGWIFNVGRRWKSSLLSLYHNNKFLAFSSFFQLFSTIFKAYFDQLSESAAPKSFSKYTTLSRYLLSLSLKINSFWNVFILPEMKIFLVKKKILCRIRPQQTSANISSDNHYLKKIVIWAYWSQDLMTNSRLKLILSSIKAF